MRSHGLGAAAMARVESAAWSGRRLDDPAERAAVVDLATASLPRPPSSGRSRGRAVLLGVCWATAMTAFVVPALVGGQWGD